jgi:hemolysin III
LEKEVFVNNKPQHHAQEQLTVLAEEIKPLLRGWFHAAASVGALLITIALLIKTYGNTASFIGALVFGLSMVVLYTVSSIYHIGTWQGRRERVLRAFDHANIFLLIAGTYTPICVNVLTGHLRVTMLVLIWGLAALGIGSVVFTMRLPRAVMTGLYMGMGWVALIAIPELLRQLPLPATLLLGTGGLLYTMGAVVYALRRPNPLPHIFGFHEIFHLFVIAGSSAFVAAIWVWVV